MKYLINYLIAISSFSLLFSTINVQYCQSDNFQLTEFAYSGYKWTGVAVSQEARVFVNYPRWSTIPYSVCELIDSQLVKYPNDEWNMWTGSTPPENHFVCVQSVYIDDEDFLWVLDPASIGGNVVEGGAKLIKVDLETDSVIQIIYFDNSITSGESYLNDVRIDTERGFAYITDSGKGAIIVVNLTNGTSRRLLDHHYSTKAEFSTLSINGQTINFEIHSDGLALDSVRNFLYYKALTGNSLYKIETEILRDTNLTNIQVESAVEFVIETLPCDAIEFHPDGKLFFTAIEENAIYYLTPSLDFTVALTDNRLKWPDSFSITPNGEIYVTTSRIYFPPDLHGLFIITGSPTDVGKSESKIPNDFNLYQNYPNPFNPITKIKYDIPENAFASIKSYNILGNVIETLMNEEQQAGSYEITWNADNLPSGVYFYRLQAVPTGRQAGSFVDIKKMVLLR
jgi:sugar lactone lactonase YvrE